MPRFQRLLALTCSAGLLIACSTTPVVDEATSMPDASLETEYPTAAFAEITHEESREIRPGVVYTYRETADPMKIHVLEVDATRSDLEFRTVLAKDSVNGVETVRSMVDRTGALAGVNGDYWTFNGVPLGFTVVDGQIAIAPKHRTAFAVRDDGVPLIDVWTNGWSWSAEVVAPNGERHGMQLLNSDCNPGWMCLYNDLWGKESRGDSVSPVTEVVIDGDGVVTDVRTDMPGVQIPEGGYVITGRDDAGEWLKNHFAVGQTADLDLKADKPLDNIEQAIGAGPRVMLNGQYFQDPIKVFPDGEEFTLDWKENHYLKRQPRSAVGIDRDHEKVILMTIDGRQPEYSIGVYQHQVYELMKEFGAWNAMDLDSGGSATMVLEGELLNSPSDNASPSGGGGTERPVANALLLFYED